MISMAQRKSFCLYVITLDGIDHARKLKNHYKEDVDVFVSKKLIDKTDFPCDVLPLPFKNKIGEWFSVYDCHVFIISVGAVVRMISPFIKDKKTDPAVICIDDTAKFTIPILSGHIGRGNEYAQNISDILGALPVITTASDSKGTLPVDILGRDIGFVLEDNSKNLTRGAAAVVNEEPVLLCHEQGEAGFWPLDKNLPKNIHYVNSLKSLDVSSYSIILYMTDKAVESIDPKVVDNAVIYRPKSLVVGMGCDKDTSMETLEEGLNLYFKEFSLSPKSIKELVSVDAKKDEKGLIELSKKLGVPFRTFSAETLDALEEGIENPSEVVKKYIGTKTVAEGACLYASSSKKLLVSKQKHKDIESNKNMTLAIARTSFEPRKELAHGK